MVNSGFRVPDLIMKKRDGKVFTQEEINFLIESVSDSNNNNSIQQSQIGKKKFQNYLKLILLNF